MAACLLLDHTVTSSLVGDSKQNVAMELSSRLPIDCIKTTLSVCIDWRGAGQQKSDFPACMLSQWEMQN